MESPPCETRRLLIVEDDRELYTVLERSARRHCPNLAIDWASDVAGATRQLRCVRYDAVLADYVLGPDERGTALLRPFRTHQAEARFAIMSATPLAELLDRVPDPTLQLLPKPFTSAEFAAFVQSLVEPAEDFFLASAIDDASMAPSTGGMACS